MDDIIFQTCHLVLLAHVTAPMQMYAVPPAANIETLEHDTFAFNADNIPI